MAFDIHAASASQAAPSADDELSSKWGERIVTIVATSAAVLIVATIAVLMGMA